MTLSNQDYIEGTGSPLLEIVRVVSNQTGDSYVSKKFQRIKSVMVQNHGATFAAGVVRDAPKLIIQQGGTTGNAKIGIIHTATTEVFSLLIIGEF